MAKDNILNQTIAAVPIVLAVIDRELAIEQRKLAELQRAAMRGSRGGRRRFPFGRGSHEEEQDEAAKTEAAESPSDDNGAAPEREVEAATRTVASEGAVSLPTTTAPGSGSNDERAETSADKNVVTRPATTLAARFGLADPTVAPTSSGSDNSPSDATNHEGAPPSPEASEASPTASARALAAGLALHAADLPLDVQDAQRFQAEDPDALPRALVAAHQAGALPPDLAEVVAELRAESGSFQAAEAWAALEQEEGA